MNKQVEHLMKTLGCTEAEAIQIIKDGGYATDTSYVSRTEEGHQTDDLRWWEQAQGKDQEGA